MGKKELKTLGTDRRTKKWWKLVGELESKKVMSRCAWLLHVKGNKMGGKHL